MTRRVEISYKTIVFTTFFLISLILIWRIRELIYALFLAFIFMSALKPLVKRLESFRFPTPLAVLVVVISTLIVGAFIFAFMIPPIVSQTLEFLTNLPDLLTKTFPFMKGWLNTDAIVQFLPDLTQNALKVLGSVFSNLFFIVSVAFFTFYFLMEEKFTEAFLLNFLEEKKAKRIEQVLRKAELRMGAWMRGELVLMTAVGVITYIVLTILGVPYALSLAFLAGMLEVIPILGPIVAAIPAFIVASASSSLFLGGLTLVMYMVIQQLENNILVPYIMNKAVGIHPITTLIALSIGATLGGVVGAILAVPVALALETIITEY